MHICTSMHMTYIQERANFYKVLSEPVRLQILQFLLQQDSCVCICEIMDCVQKDQSVVSRHIQLMQKTGLVDTHREGRFLMCCIKDKRQIKKVME